MSSDALNQEVDVDPVETEEWRDALASVVEFEGKDRAEYIIKQLMQYAKTMGLESSAVVNAGTKHPFATPYANTIAPSDEPDLPDDIDHMKKLMPYMRWNAIAMVMRAGKFDSSLGGHIASYASAALLYEIGFNYFYHGKNKEHGGDCLFIQGHSSPGVYARAFLEGRITKEQLDGFRQEFSKNGLSSYPHPWLMPDFWQFPTVSMGLGPLMSIYLAHFMRYMHSRELADTQERKVWVYCGDGELGEPESLGALNLAARESLDNLIFVVNCNLQRLDGPVWGSGQIIQEYESVFRGAGWNVIKVIWGSGWDKLFAKDKSGLLMKRIGELVDGEYQHFSARDGSYLRENFFGKYPELLELVSDMTDEQLKTELQDGGHDPIKVYAAYAAAVKHTGQPTVILVKTVKGYGMGQGGEGLNVTHQTKKLSVDHLKAFCHRFNLSLTDKQIETLEYASPAKNSAEMEYLKTRRKEMGGYLPKREFEKKSLPAPDLEAFHALLEDSGEREISTTMAFVRVLAVLLKDKALKDYVVPIVADESRTFGMEGLFRQVGIYSPYGQAYEPEDRKQLMYYREDKKGQLLQEGLSEAGAMSSWIAAATSYSVNDQPMIPFYIYYSMFGYQRVGDLVWAAGDIRARGFILGGTAGRTTINGEGLQHQDGHNILMFSMVPNCVSYDPTFAYELAVIMRNGLKRMMQNQEDVFYYLTVMNENYHHPAMPEGDHVEEHIIKGMYLFKRGGNAELRVQLLGSGTILREVIAAASILEKEYNVAADVWSVTSFNELRKDSESAARFNRLNPEAPARQSHVGKCLVDQIGPVIAATDYMKLFAEQIRQDIRSPYYVLGTDGFGRSDTRAALRDFFEVDAKMIVYTALKALANNDQFDEEKLLAARERLGIEIDRPDPITV